MGLRLPESRQSSAPRTSRQYDNSDLILKVLGNNPYAQAVDQVTPVIAQALQKRAELRRQAMQVQQLAQAAGEEPPTGSSLTPDMYEKLLSIKSSQSARKSDAARSRTDLELKLEGLRTGSTEIDPLTGKRTERPGVQGLSIKYDEAGNPFIERGEGYKPKVNSNGGGRGGLGMLTDPKIRKSLLEKFNAEQTVRRAQGSIDSAKVIRDLVSSNNPIAANAIPTYMARASGEVGALSEADKAPFGGSQAILSRLQNALYQKAKGQLAPENAQFLAQLSQIMETSANRNLDDLARLRAQQYVQITPGSSEDDLYNILRPRTALHPLPSTQQETPEQRKARLLQELSGAR